MPLLILAAIVALVVLSRTEAARDVATSASDAAVGAARSTLAAGGKLLDQLGGVVRQGWTPPLAAAPYLDAIYAAELRYGLPGGLLARVLYQESRYRDDIISGATPSPTGALGIAQFMPDTAAELGIDPTDPAQAIPAAARYLAQLYGMFGDWTAALAAYNWGLGNVRRQGIGHLPRESIAYANNVLVDVNIFS